MRAGWSAALGQGPGWQLAARPRASALLAAGGLSFTAIFFVLSEASASTATFFRCLYALPILWLLARREDAAVGPRPWSARRWAGLAGVFFAIDLLLFHQSILLLGAGLATVLSNMQVVFVLLAAWLLWGERAGRAQMLGIPIALAGIVLISGVLGGSTYGEDPALGALLGLGVAAAYATYLLILRKGRDRLHAAGPILDATLACAVTALLVGVASGDVALLPTWPGHAWLVLLALTSQVGAGILLAVALPRLPAVTTSLILLAQPVLAVALAMIILAETPSPTQLAGVGLVIAGVLLGSVVVRPSQRRQVRRPPEPRVP